MASSSSSCPSSSESLFGWDLMINTLENELKTPEDVLTSFIHLVLVNTGFRCIGLGDSKSFDGSETKSEALPKGWSECTAIRYSFQGRLYILKSIRMDAGIMFNLLRVDEKSTSLLRLDNSHVSTMKPNSLELMIPKYTELLRLAQDQLIKKVIQSKKTRDCSSQTDSDKSRTSVSSSTIPQLDPDRRGGYPAFVPAGPSNVGEYDLYPFGRMPGVVIPPRAGGMLYEPPRTPRYPSAPNIGVPPGSIPPGARFDPFRPPDGRNPPRRFGSDNDEFPPPGYDDMFM